MFKAIKRKGGTSLSDLITIGGVYAPITVYQTHEHNNWEIVYYSSGEGTVIIRDVPHSFQAGDIFFIEPGAPHTDTSAVGYTNMYLEISASPVTEKYLHHTMRVTDSPSRDIYNLLLMIQREHYIGNDSHHEVIRLLIETVLCLAHAIKDEQPKSPYVEQIKAILAKNVSNPTFNLDEIYSTTLHLNKDYVRRLFKKETGVTPNTYLKDLRISHAKNLLADSSISQNIKKIALSSGFADQYYFSRLFKREVGMSPMAWKAQNSAKR